MFVDASAIVAILTRESTADRLVAALNAQDYKITSPIAIWEATVRIVSKKEKSVADAMREVKTFMDIAEIREISIDPGITETSLVAFERFGKGRNPARLNLGDCFAYACAKAHKVPLLYVGNDFALTDVNDGHDIA